MPNHCYNHLTIKSDDTGFLQKLMNEFKVLDEHPDFLSILCPYTEEIGYDWNYDWCVENWGTKWDIFDVASAGLEGNTLYVTFSTAWTPPVKALQAGAEKYGYEFSLYYQEDGCCFAGHASGDEDECYETFTDEHPEDYIPEHILDELPFIVEDWEEWQAEKELEDA